MQAHIQTHLRTLPASPTCWYGAGNKTLLSFTWYILYLYKYHMDDRSQCTYCSNLSKIKSCCCFCLYSALRTNCNTQESSCGFPVANLSLLSNNREVSILKLFVLEAVLLYRMLLKTYSVQSSAKILVCPSVFAISESTNKIK